MAPPSKNGKFFIEVEDLHKSFGGQKVHRGVSLTVKPGETMVVIGGSGEGKSVLLKQLLGLTQPDSGSIKVEGREIVGQRERELGPVRQKMGILFQHGALFDSLDVEDNVGFPLREQGESTEDQIAKRVHECLAAVELAEHKKKMPVNLSGGMRKRVALARAIVTSPKCVLYDEPTAGLDPIVSDSINYLIRRIQKSFDVTSIVVTHDMKSVFHVADRIAFLRKGEIYFCGTAEELRAAKDPTIVDFIEGRSREVG